MSKDYQSLDRTEGLLRAQFRRRGKDSFLVKPEGAWRAFVHRST